MGTTAERTTEVNRVEITGRVSGPPASRTLPSGDELVTLRVVVARDDGQPVDTIDCACWSASTRRAAARASAIHGMPPSRVAMWAANAP